MDAQIIHSCIVDSWPFSSCFSGQSPLLLRTVPLHESQFRGLVKNFWAGPGKLGATLEATLLQMATPCVPEDHIWRAFGGGADGKRTVGNIGTSCSGFNIEIVGGCGNNKLWSV